VEPPSGPPARRFATRRCGTDDASGCGLRFPVDEGSPLGASCPHCGGPTRFVDDAYPTHEVARTRVHAGPRLGVLLDNVRSLTNVGSMFRTADGVGVELIVLGGITPTPAHPKLAKTALGAQSSVPWRFDPDAARAAARCIAEGWELWALDAGPRAVSLFELPPRSIEAPPLMLVCGHEVSGIDPRITALCTRVVFLPMAGIKGSLNVSVAFGVAAYAVRHDPRRTSE
jgi:tRNA G18 (ribose-2'-O)-methylase SpoU